jgi:hypothetical protein
MKRMIWQIIVLTVTGLFLLVPVAGTARAAELQAGAPPVEQPLANEGDFAISLGAALAVATTNDAVEAESSLGELGIAPRNGWVADYPVTPDIILELRDAVATAADRGALSQGRGAALQQFDEVAAAYGLAVQPYTPGTTYDPSAISCANYPNPAMIQQSYNSAGVPVVTYYCPPPDYYAMYSWVASPFRWYDLWFPGFFILRDFHRVVHHHDRTIVIRNHFNDLRHTRVYRIDANERFRGKTFGGIGVPRARNVISTGVPRGERIIFNNQGAGRPAGSSPAVRPFSGGERRSGTGGGGDRGGRSSGGGSGWQRGR